MNYAILKKLLLMTVSLMLMACVPEGETTFNTMIDSKSGDGMSLQLDEDTTKKFAYSIPILEDAIDPTYTITSNPGYGTLEGCDQSDKTKIDCTYVPNSDFNGVDYVEVTARDGGIIAKSSAKIRFDVRPVNDAPSISGGHQINVQHNTSQIFQALKGQDIDGDKLEYIITQNPTQGILSDCFLANSLHCTYTPSTGYTGNDYLQYKVRDSSGVVSPGEATLSIVVSDKAIYANAEQFKVKDQGVTRVDIVWVIDNSGSMQNEQEALQKNFASFINGFFVDQKPRFDFNMMVTTTDAYIANNPKAALDPASGDLYNLSSAAAMVDFNKFQNDFTKAVGVGVRGNGSERALLSLESNYVTYTNWFGGNDSLLVYVVLSDEREQSFDKTINEWTTYVQGLKADPKHSKIYPIINLGADNGNRYAELATNFGTQLYDINAPFDAILNSISTDISSQTNALILSVQGMVIESSIQVNVNGAVLDKSQYSFNQGAKAVQFAQALPANSTVDISYSYTN